VNINKYGVGKRKSMVDTRGKTHSYKDKFYFKVGEITQLIDAVGQDDLMYYQFNMPIEREEYEKYRQRGIPIPESRLGFSVMCQCGSEVVYANDPNCPEWMLGKLICKSLAMFGVHQTSMVISDGKIKLPKYIEQDKLLLDSDMEKLWGKKDK